MAREPVSSWKNPARWRNAWARPSVRRGAAGVAGLVVLLALVLGFREQRDPVGTDAATAEEDAVARAAAEPIAGIPVEEWTPRFRELQERDEWGTLVEHLDEIRERQPADYARFELGYLHARAYLESGKLDEATEALEPYLRDGHGLRDVALHHRARIAEIENEDEAAPFREQLIWNYPSSPYRDMALEAHLDWLEKKGDPEALRAFGAQLTGASKSDQREIESRVVLLEATTNPRDAVAKGIALLRTATGDDAGDRVFRALDRPEILASLGAEEKVLLGAAAQGHRHYDRAVALLGDGLKALPSRREDLLFAIGRSHFGAERFAEAEQAYLQCVEAVRSGADKATYLYHASRAAQLAGNDARAEQHLARTISLGAKTSRAAVGLTQRIRTRLAAGRVKEAEADWVALRKRHRRDRAFYEGTLAWAVGLIARDRGSAARAAFKDVPPGLMEKADRAEMAYWIGRSWESRDPAQAVAAWSPVLLTTYPTHYDVFVQERLREPKLRKAADDRIARLRTTVRGHLAAQRFAEARDAQTEIYLLSIPAKAGTELAALVGIYRQLPVYKDVLQLARQPLPRLPVTVSEAPGADGLRSDRHDLLLALGLLDDATDQIGQRYGLTSAALGLTRSQALSMAGSTRASIGAAESTMQRIPDEYHADLLPSAMRRLLYPRVYWERITEEAGRHGADPRLVLSIMREESRFNPRAHSPAAARGLLQFIIGTARDVGQAVGLVDVQPEQLYDPDVIIRLGARYIGDLMKQFEGDRYRAAAAYNAGPVQTRLWSRLQAGPGRDYFLVAVNFDETKNYVRKVMNSYVRYGEIYGEKMDRRVDADAEAAGHEAAD